MSLRTIHVVVNPASGSRQSSAVYEREVVPYIQANAPQTKLIVHETTAEGDGVNVARTIMAAAAADASKGEDVKFILVGGDGTTHEVLNGLVEHDDNGRHSIPLCAQIAIVPTGTANALYAALYAKQKGPSFDQDKLRSVRSLLQSSPNTVPLALSSVRTTDRPVTLAHLITSHALHASILADSEHLRIEHPGIERFKMAFAQNMAKWVPAKLELQPLDGRVQRYDPKSSEFVDVNDIETTIDDVFMYFACLTTDRLEPAFVPAPYSGPFCERKDVQRPPNAVDVLLYRPLRNPALAKHADAGQDFWTSSQSEDLRQEIGKTHLLHISGLMYQEGRHVDLTYASDGNLQEKGDGSAVFEYYRCAGYTWTAQESSARRTCIDGTVVESDSTSVRVLSQDEGAGRVVVCR